MAKLGFYFDAESCIACHTCQVACKDVNGLPVGVNYREVRSFCTGGGWEPRSYNVSVALAGCNLCSSLREVGEEPPCVASCPMRAIEFGDVDEPVGLAAQPQRLRIVEQVDAVVALDAAYHRVAAGVVREVYLVQARSAERDRHPAVEVGVARFADCSQVEYKNRPVYTLPPKSNAEKGRQGMGVSRAETAMIGEAVEARRDELVELCRDLVRCKTPCTTGDTRDALAVAARFLDAHGLPYEISAACKTMPNLMATLDSGELGRHLMMNGHLDVMPAGSEPGWTCDPWGGEVRSGRIWGRGTSDMKAGVAAMLVAYSVAAERMPGLRGRLSITLVSDEESGCGRGTGHLFERFPERMQADAVLSGEPSGADAVSFASKGYASVTVRTRARGAIAGYGHESGNAADEAMAITAELKALERERVGLPGWLARLLDDPSWVAAHEALRGRGHADQLGRIAVDVCKIRGGDFWAAIPSACTVELAVTYPTPEALALVERRVREVASRHPGAEVELWGADGPDFSDPDGELARMVCDAAEALGRPRPQMAPEIAISDCRYWRYRGTPAYWYGPGGENCSAADESVSVDDLVHVAKTHAAAAIGYLRG